MPKSVSEDERKLTREAIYENTVDLIKKKGIRAVTVDDIANAVGIGKGTFYFYYPSKEVCLFEAIKRWEREIFTRMEGIMTSIHSDKDKAILLLREAYTAEGSPMLLLSPVDVEVLLRKLPEEYREQWKTKSESNFKKALQLMDLNDQQMEVVALLTDCLSFVASDKTYSKKGTDTALNLLIDAISGYLSREVRI